MVLFGLVANVCCTCIKMHFFLFLRFRFGLGVRVEVDNRLGTAIVSGIRLGLEESECKQESKEKDKEVKARAQL